MVQIIKNKIEKRATPEPVRPEIEKILPPEKKAEIEKPPAPEKVEVPLPGPEKVEVPPAKAPPPSLPPRPPKSETLVRIEKILEEDLNDIYFKMPQKKQEEFKEKGEEAASKIEKMVEAGKTVAKKILKLIREWLKLIPGVNKFFLEQEAKIKTDKIVVLAEKEKEKQI
jgi:hypothetical protein